MMTNLYEELTKILNMFSIENESNTPDYILALYMLACLRAFNDAVNERTSWYKNESEE
jgi:hypothetical protein